MENFLGRNVKVLRKKRNLTLVELANALNISKSALSDYEKGKSRPGIDVVIKLSNFFYIPTDDLNNSEIPEFESIELKASKPVKNQLAIESLEEITQWKQKHDFQVNLLKQKNESLETQLALVKELLLSKEAENKSLGIRIRLLEEKLK